MNPATTSHDTVAPTVRGPVPDDASSPRVDVGGVHVDPVTEKQVIKTVVRGWRLHRGGLIVTPNVDIWRRARRDEECARIVDVATLVVADGQPLVWASKLAGTPVPERVTGSGLVETLCAAAASEQRRVYIVGGGTDDVAERAAAALEGRHGGLQVVGHVVPAFGFESSPEQLDALIEGVVATDPDLVLVGLGFPKQERLALMMTERLPRAWFLGCGGGVAMAAGDQRRSPVWAQRLGVEWLVRMAQEPRRLAHRYLIEDVPAAAQLLLGTVAGRVGSRSTRHKGR